MTFDNEALTKAVNKALAVVPVEHDGAVVSYSTAEGVTAAVAHRINDGWQIATIIQRPPNGKIGVSVQSSWTW